MKLSISTVLILFALVGIASGAGLASQRARWRGRPSTFTPRECKSVKWASGYPKKTERNKVDCVDCSAAFQFTRSLSWERTVTLETKISLSLPDVLGANLEASQSITNSKGSASSYTCRRTVSKFECIVVKYTEITLEGKMIKRYRRRFGPGSKGPKGVRCVQETDYVRVVSVRSPFVDCEPRTSLWCPSLGFSHLVK